MSLKGLRVHVSGIVQGVGFRPFVYGLAAQHGLKGWVRNTSAGVDIELDGDETALSQFLDDLRQKPPALARLDHLEHTWQAAHGFEDFQIIESQADPSDFLPVSPDVSICADCLSELFNPQDRRYRYPFINCTNCGPRFTIIGDIPYDRPNTTMAGFPLCPACDQEYHDPLNRRFHAQPVACPECGPHIWLELGTSTEPVAYAEASLGLARQLLLEGKILAIKGLGGFHLACDATNPQAVSELRRRKLRVDKAFALMAADAEMAAQHAWLSKAERLLLESRQRPIVIARRRSDSPIAAQVAPGQNTLGIMLPYTPLHYLLFANPAAQTLEINLPPLVMTSGNLSEEPICTDNDEAREHLGSLADAFLMHNRSIHTRCDDSVVRVFPALRRERTQSPAPSIYPLRRARGYAPDPISLSTPVRPLLATGAELKNTFCLTRGSYAFLSHHIGDLENYPTLQAFTASIEHYQRLFRIQPQAIAYDLHPNYLATRYAVERAAQQGLPAVGVQHHHAHIAACMADNGLDGTAPLIGVSFDGTGYGEDGAVWGGEFLIADAARYERAVHLAYTPLPGGDLATRQPWRMALSWLAAAGVDWAEDLPPVQHALSLSTAGVDVQAVLRKQLSSGLNSPLTSSMGRLFDAVAALMGVRQEVNYEAQAAIEMEALADGNEPGYYTLELRQDVLDPSPLFHQLVQDLRLQISPRVMAARLHGGIARATADVCRTLRAQRGLNAVALSGGVWQNTYLLALTTGLLQEDGFEVYIHRRVPANDGGLALGQAFSAQARLRDV
jgi:hydrogenase maturation protein HypF